VVIDPIATMALEQLDAAAPAAVAPVLPAASIAPAPAEGKRWVKMRMGVSGPDLSLAPNDDHEFEATEAQSLIDAGFADPTDAPNA
jgi:hypothetical protein